jgi:hypothetical protein
MLAKPIFETLPIAIIAASILLMLLVHSLPSFIVGGCLIAIACVMLYLRLSQLGTDPGAMDYTDPANRKI